MWCERITERFSSGAFAVGSLGDEVRSAEGGAVTLQFIPPHLSHCSASVMKHLECLLEARSLRSESFWGASVRCFRAGQCHNEWVHLAASVASVQRADWLIPMCTVFLSKLVNILAMYTNCLKKLVNVFKTSIKSCSTSEFSLSYLGRLGAGMCNKQR